MWQKFFLVFSGTRNSNIAFIFSLDAVLFYKNLCLDNRIYFRALNSYIKTRMSWEKANVIFEFLVTKSFEKNFVTNFMYIFQGVKISIFKLISKSKVRQYRTWKSFPIDKIMIFRGSEHRSNDITARRGNLIKKAI